MSWLSSINNVKEMRQINKVTAFRKWLQKVLFLN